MHRRNPKTITAAAKASAATKAAAKAAADAAKLAEQKEQRGALEKCDREVVLDVGKRLMICGLIIDHTTGTYRHIKFSAEQYHHMCKKDIFKNRREALTKEIDKEMRIDREKRKNQSEKTNAEIIKEINIQMDEENQQPSSRSSDFKKYTKHTLEHFDRAMAAYNTKKYARINYDQWVQTKRTLVEIVRLNVGNDITKNVVVIVGDKLPGANSAVCGYRCTQTHELFKLLDEHPRCKVFFGSEHRSSKCCCRCGQVLQNGRIGESRRKAHEANRQRSRGSRTQKSRTKICLVCEALDLASKIPQMRSPLPTKSIYILKNNRCQQRNWNN